MILYENHWFGNSDMYIPEEMLDKNFPVHFHRAFEFIYVTEGTLFVEIEEDTYELGSGRGVVIFPNQLHSLKTKENSKIYLVIFAPEMIGHFSTQFINMVPADNLLENVEIEEKEIFTDNIYLQKAVLYKICGLLLESTDFILSEKSTKYNIIHNILNYIDLHYAEECSLKTLTKALKYDYAYISRLFTKAINMSYTEYLNRYRINYACYLLKNKKITACDAGMSCGFENIRSFNRNFKKFTGMTPTEFCRN